MDTAQGQADDQVVTAGLAGTVVRVAVAVGQSIPAGRTVAVIESMKMEHPVVTECGGTVVHVWAEVGQTVDPGDPIITVSELSASSTDEAAADPARSDANDPIDPAAIRPDLDEVRRRHALGLDPARPESVERRRRTGQRTTRENIADLCDPDSFVEYGALVVAAQRRRRTFDELIHRTPADGLVSGVGTVAGRRTIVLSYDYTVLAGTQGVQNHRKKDRLFDLAERLRLPVVLFAEGGGGRPGDTDSSGLSGLDTMAFALFAGLSGLVPLIGITSGRCFAGNAALLGCCDVVIATAGSNIGMGGPAMIEGGGLGVFTPDEIGPMSVQVPNGVVDIAVSDEAEAVRVAQQYLGYFDGSGSTHPTGSTASCADQRQLRHVVPENRLRIYDIRQLVATLADDDSVLELRREFGVGMVTAMIRIGGRAMGVIANEPAHLGGAIDADAADKASRFMQLCDAHDVPILLLCDTPGFMVGPDAEATAQVRHVSRMFVTGASLTVPFFTIVVRKGYGLGAQAMAGGSFRSPIFTIAWPTGEFGGMGLEGAVRLGFRDELAAEPDPIARQELFDGKVARLYEQGKAVNAATYYEIDAVIDPADSRSWITMALDSVPPPEPRTGKKRPCIDTW